MKAESISAAGAGEYARYLESKTIAPEPGAYYLTPEGEPTQPTGRWLSSPDTLARLGIEGEQVVGHDFVALMEGRHPRTGRWLRPEGAGGGRGGGIDVVFSAPKSISAVWALAGDEQRSAIEAAHSKAVAQALAHIRDSVSTVRRRREGVVIEEPARDLLACEYRHTTARGVDPEEMPDPQLHSHVVITGALRQDGRFVAVASRPIFRCAREGGAYYRAALAEILAAQGYAIERGTGKHGRYFELRGVPRELCEELSARSKEVGRAIERFRARWGRAPRRGELRRIKAQGRLRKVLVNRGDLDRAWQQTAARHGFDRQAAEALTGQRTPARDPEALERRIEARLTERAATFTQTELRAVALEQAVGELPPAQALVCVQHMIEQGTVIELEDGRMTTLAQRAREQAIERRLLNLAQLPGRDVGPHARREAADRIAERIGACISEEQKRALEVITGPERAAVLIGPAGTGKGVVIDAAARAERLRGNETLGIAVSGSTAQRLGHDSPALAGQTMTLDALVARANHGRLELNERTTVYLDEAGMVDTERLEHLAAVVERMGAKLVLIGDAAQLPSIGAGGMFERLAQRLTYAELRTVRRTRDPREQRAWTDLRAGHSDRAMAHYRARGRLHMRDDRDHAVESAVRTWADLTKEHGVEQVALLSDASNQEIDRMNARAQHLRAQRGELGERGLEIPGLHYGIREGDRVALTDQHRAPGQTRIENGSCGRVAQITPAGEALVEFDLTGRRRLLAGDDLASVRLGYAHHIHRAQGATVQRSVVVTGSWQVSKESAYVQASRAREGTDWFVARDELGTEGQDADRVERLAALMRRSERQLPSLAYRERRDDRFGDIYERGLLAPARALLNRFLPTVTRSRESPARGREAGMERAR